MHHPGADPGAVPRAEGRGDHNDPVPFLAQGELALPDQEPFAEGMAVRRRATSRLSKHFDHIQESTGHRPVELDGHVIAAGHSVDLVVRSNLAVFYMKLARALKP